MCIRDRVLATLQAAGRGFPKERQERQTISREDALKRAQELFEKRGKDGEVFAFVFLVYYSLHCYLLGEML